MPKSRGSMGNPLLLEELLVRHPKPACSSDARRLSHDRQYAHPVAREPHVYVDVAGLIWSYPIKEVNRYIERLVDGDAIGEWHDWEELVAIAKTVIEHGSNCGLLDDLRNIADCKYQKALTLTEDMRRKFLPMSDRRNKRSPRHAAFRPTEPVWLATAALVA